MLSSAPEGYVTADGGVALSPQGIPTWLDSTGAPISIWVWDSLVGGSQITDMLDHNGNVVEVLHPISSGVSTDLGRILGYIPAQYRKAYFSQGNGGTRWIVIPTETYDKLDVAIQDSDDAKASAAAAATSADQAAADSAAAVLKVNDTQAQQDQLKLVAATVDDLVANAIIDGVWSGSTLSPTVPIAGLTQRYLFTAPFDLTIQNFNMVWGNFNLTANETNYWAVRLDCISYLTGTVTRVVSKKSLASLSNSIVAGKAWTFDGADWGTRTMNAHDTLRIQFSTAGAPPVMTLPVACTLGYSV